MREHIVINSDRSVTVPDSLKKIGIQYDHNVNTLTFDCPRYADDAQSIDMSKMQIFINWMLPDKSIGSSIAENIVVDETDNTLMHFDWVITNAVTPVSGILERTLVCIKQTDAEGHEVYHWNTDLFQKFSVGEGMECNEQLAEENMDVITQLLVKMDAVDTRTSTEAMQGYVSEYMTENPPQPSNEQATAGVASYMTENGQSHVNTYMGENAQSAVNTYMDVNAQSKVNTYMGENGQEHVNAYMEENAQGKVDDYLGRKPLQLDDTLTDPTKAAPADKVGEISTEVDELKGDLTQVSESITDIQSNSGLLYLGIAKNNEIIFNNNDVNVGDTVEFSFHALTGYTGYIKIVKTDGTYTWVGKNQPTSGNLDYHNSIMITYDFDHIEAITNKTIDFDYVKILGYTNHDIYNSVFDVFSNIADLINGTVSLDGVEGYNISSDGHIYPSTNRKISKKILCKGQHELSIGASQNSDTNAFYDRNGRFINTFIIGNPNNKIVVPENAFYFILCHTPDMFDSILIQKNSKPSIADYNKDKLSAITASVAAPDYNHSTKDTTHEKAWKPLILFVTDVHDDFDAFNRALDFADSCDEIVCTVSLGDIVTFENPTKAKATELFTSHNKPCLRVLGNHEVMYNTGDLSTLVDTYYNNDIVSHSGEVIDTGKAYWYKDISVNNEYETKKLRLIGICEFENNSVDVAFSDAQLNWLCNTLESCDSETYIVILSHYIGHRDNSAEPYNEYFTPKLNMLPYKKYTGMELISKIIDAWMHGTTVSFTNNDTIFSHTFTGNHVNSFMGWFNGHEHSDGIWTVEDYPKQVNFNLPCTCSKWQQTGFGDLPRRQNDKTVDCITLASFDWYTHGVNLIRLGSDVTIDMRDRKYAYVKLPD